MKKFLTGLLVLGALGAGLIMLARFLFPLPSLDGRSASAALPPSAQTALGAGILPQAEAHPGLSGVYPLSAGAEAFASRMALARAAEHSLDVRYYIWQKDSTGLMLLDELRAAALRGVRVRLLVDDNGTGGLDPELSALNALPDMQVRIFNPFTLRSPRMASYLFDFPRLNHRMHNKSFNADGIATIVGGRNVGDIYFSRDETTQYSDFDLLIVGDAVQDVADDFDRYWNSQSAYPHSDIVAPDPAGLTALASALAQVRADETNQRYETALTQTPLVQSLRRGTLPLEWAAVELVSDDPAKGLGHAAKDQLMIVRLGEILGEAEQSIDLVSAYFVPGPRGASHLTQSAHAGTATRTVTNALEATDVLPVHASYVKYRDELVDAGVHVYELARDQGRAEAKALGLLGGSAASLHAKTVTLDENRVFVGSFNFDPRSALLNCEMGFLVHSPALASAMRNNFETGLDRAAYRVTRTQSGDLQWQITRDDGTVFTTTDEPGSSATDRALLWIMGILPIEWLM
ncbi:MAG: phospholipase D family protein [Sulfitobacter sp.]